MHAGSGSVVVADRSTMSVRPGSCLVTRHHEATDPDLETVIGSAEIAQGYQYQPMSRKIQWKTHPEAGVECRLAESIIDGTGIDLWQGPAWGRSMDARIPAGGDTSLCTNCSKPLALMLTPKRFLRINPRCRHQPC